MTAQILMFIVLILSSESSSDLTSQIAPYRLYKSVAVQPASNKINTINTLFEVLKIPLTCNSFHQLLNICEAGNDTITEAALITFMIPKNLSKCASCYERALLFCERDKINDIYTKNNIITTILQQFINNNDSQLISENIIMSVTRMIANKSTTSSIIDVLTIAGHDGRSIISKMARLIIEKQSVYFLEFTLTVMKSCICSLQTQESVHLMSMVLQHAYDTIKQTNDSAKIFAYVTLVTKVMDFLDFKITDQHYDFYMQNLCLKVCIVLADQLTNLGVLRKKKRLTMICDDTFISLMDEKFYHFHTKEKFKYYFGNLCEEQIKYLLRSHLLWNHYLKADEMLFVVKDSVQCTLMMNILHENPLNLQNVNVTLIQLDLDKNTTILLSKGNKLHLNELFSVKNRHGKDGNLQWLLLEEVYLLDFTQQDLLTTFKPVLSFWVNVLNNYDCTVSDYILLAINCHQKEFVDILFEMLGFTHVKHYGVDDYCNCELQKNDIQLLVENIYEYNSLCNGNVEIVSGMEKVIFGEDLTEDEIIQLMRKESIFWKLVLFEYYFYGGYDCIRIRVGRTKSQLIESILLQIHLPVEKTKRVKRSSRKQPYMTYDINKNILLEWVTINERTAFL